MDWFCLQVERNPSMLMAPRLGLMNYVVTDRFQQSFCVLVFSIADYV